MKHKRTGTHLWNRALALLMAVFVTVQLTVPAYAEMNTEPVEQDPTTVAMQLEDTAKPADPEALPEEETEAEAPAEPVEDAEPAEDAAPAEDAEPAQDEPAVAAEETKEANSLDIPGYTRVTGDTLEVGKYYLIVSQSSDGKLYALYPDASGKSLSSGNAINTEGTLVADLTVNGKNVTAQWGKDSSSLDMNQLHFILEKNGNKYAFKSRANESIYLGLDNNMLTETPTYFSVTQENGGKYLIKNDGTTRMLDFNKAGDAHQYPGNFKTNFWGPKDKRFPIYLYTKDGETAPVIATGELRAAIANAQNMLNSVDEASRTALQAAIDSANKLLATGNIKQEQVDAEVAKLVAVIQSAKPDPNSIAPGAPKPGTTKGQPFSPGAGTSQNFRIPAMITLKHQKDEALNGRVVTAIDARWNHTADASGLDTLVSYSDDNGANWNWNFANFFNDSVNSFMHGSTAFIDPELVEGKDGTIYLMVDLFPGGVALNNAPRQPKAATGYQEVDGKERLVLYTSIAGQTVQNWEYYVGDFEKDGFAPVYARDNKDGKAAYYVDDHYYLYDSTKGKMYCKQMGSNKFVEQNVFFTNAALHVIDASYLWVVTSKDGGAHWSAPMILNPQVRLEEGTSKFYGVGPGAGICTQDGTVMLTAYTHDGGGKEHCSFIYSSDNGATWHRSDTVSNDGNWSSESCLVEIDANTVRQFYRDGFSTLRYTDHTKGEDGLWHAGQAVDTGVHKTWGNQLSAVRYSGTLYGKPVIMVSTAAANGRDRQNGHVYTFVLENDKTMTLMKSYTVTPGSYGYSSITELENGSVAVLYEGSGIQYTVIDTKNVVPAEEYKHVDQSFVCGESLTVPGNTKDAVVNSNPDVVEATNSLVEKQVPVLNGAQGHTGTDANFSGDVTPLSDALYRFVKTESGYQITATTKDGTQVWLSTGNIGYPSTRAAATTTLEDAGNGSFYLHCDGGYLYFYRSGNSDKLATYDRYNTTHEACKFNLYRPAAEGEKTDIPGYVQVKTLDEVKDGGFYLITAKIGDNTYVLNPTTSDNKHAQSLKLDLTADKVTNSVSYYEPEFTMTAKTAGTADVQVGATIYHVTVSHKAGDAWVSDSTGHWHECDGCDAKVEAAEHTYGEWTETKAPTETETGLKSHTCEICGYTETVEIPVVPVDPQPPVDPEQPVNPDPQPPVDPEQPVNPEQPVDPVKPVEPTKPADKDPGHVTPPTGDSTPVFLWSMIAVVCIACIAAMFVYRKKKNHN